MRKLKAQILENEEVGPGLFSIRLDVPDTLTVEPGQFFEIKTDVRFLRRAFSIADMHDGGLRLIIRVVGPGTKWLATLKPGTFLNLLGPLGQGVKLPQEGPVMLLGGGVGIAPLLFLARRLAESGITTDALLAVCSQNELICVEDFGNLTREVMIATDDGSCGREGLLTEVLPSIPGFEEAKVFYACGPEPMLAALKKLEINKPVYAFLESRMGCGTGLCVGCAVKNNNGKYIRVCLDGPVFDLGKISL